MKKFKNIILSSLFILFILTSCANNKTDEKRIKKELDKGQIIIIADENNEKIVSIKIFNNLLITKLPNSYTGKAYNIDKKIGFVNYNFLPRTETPDNWNESVSIIGIKKYKGSLESFAAATYKEDTLCKKNMMTSKIIHRGENEIIYITNCEQPINKIADNYTTLYKLIKTDNKLYSITYSWRDVVIPANYINKIIKDLDSSIVCGENIYDERCLEFENI